jgi:C1A family cysteine protease
MAKKQSQDLMSAIRAKGYEWQAGTTALSALSIAEQKGYLGLAVTSAELSAAKKAIAAANALAAVHAAYFAAPASVDWRNNNGNWTTPIKDQGGCGSCVSFATCATFESRIKITCKNASLTPDLSEAHLFFCGCGQCCGTGWNFPPAQDFCKNTGVAKESDFPYTAQNQPCKQGLTPYAKTTGWSAVLAVADRKNVLATKGPMVAGMAVYQDFFSYRSGVYRHVSGALAGYHAISVVGYDDTQKCWMCKNSWGPNWGESGWFRIGYGECGLDSQFAFYDMNAPCPVQPEDTCSKYVPWLKKVLEAVRANPALHCCLRYYVCRRGTRPRCTMAQIAVVRAVLAILRVCPRYRLPFCRALG